MCLWCVSTMWQLLCLFYISLMENWDVNECYIRFYASDLISQLSEGHTYFFFISSKIMWLDCLQIVNISCYQNKSHDRHWLSILITYNTKKTAQDWPTFFLLGVTAKMFNYRHNIWHRCCYFYFLWRPISLIEM